MRNDSVLYVVPLYVEGIRDHFNLTEYSLAGESKRRDMIEIMQANGNDVTVVAPLLANDGLLQYRSGTALRDEDLDVEVHAPPVIGGGHLQYLLVTLATILLSIKLSVTRDFDVAVFYNFQATRTLPAMCAKAVAGLPVILQYEDGLFVDPEAPTAIQVTARLLRVVFRRWVDGVVAVNNALTDLIPTNNTVIFPRFPAIGMPDELPDRSYDAQPIVVMFAGRFDRYRGVNRFLATIPAVAARSDDVIFWVAGYGSGRDRRRVQRRIDTLNREGASVNYLGTVPENEYRERVCEADVLVSLHDSGRRLSRYTFPTKLLDFMASGAVVVSNPIEDIAAPPSDAMVYTDGSDVSIVDTLVDCIECYANYEDVARRGQSWVEGNYNFESVADQIDNLLREANA